MSCLYSAVEHAPILTGVLLGFALIGVDAFFTPYWHRIKYRKFRKWMEESQ